MHWEGTGPVPFQQGLQRWLENESPSNSSKRHHSSCLSVSEVSRPVHFLFQLISRHTQKRWEMALEKCRTSRNLFPTRGNHSFHRFRSIHPNSLLRLCFPRRIAMANKETYPLILYLSHSPWPIALLAGGLVENQGCWGLWGTAPRLACAPRQSSHQSKGECVSRLRVTLSMLQF